LTRQLRFDKIGLNQFPFSLYPERLLKGGICMNSHKLRVLIVVLFCTAAAISVTGCGPSQEEIMAMEKARMEREANERQQAELRRQAEKKRRQEEERRITKIRSLESAGDQTVKAGSGDEALANYMGALKLGHDDAQDDQRLREKIINLTVFLKMRLPVPEEARRHAVRAQALLKAKQGAGFEQAVTELIEATSISPWWGDAYYNLGLMQEGAQDYAGAIRNLKLYLLADSADANAQVVRNKIYELEVLKEESDKTKAMSGTWKNIKSGVMYTVAMNGSNFKAENTNGWRLIGTKKNNSIEGTVTVPAMRRWPNNECVSPEYTVPMNATISNDERSITLRYMENNYASMHWNITTGLLGINNTGHRQGECISVTLQGSSPDEITIAH